jgi:4-hydroxy-4-methyl-2-oxoglutarate aldolase
VRDVADLRAMEFPVWSTDICAQGTVKATAGAVNVPIVLGGQLVRPGDAVIADDDGVIVVARAEVDEAVSASRARVAKEGATRTALAAGELGLDRYDLRPLLARLGVEYVRHSEEGDGGD